MEVLPVVDIAIVFVRLFALFLLLLLLFLGVVASCFVVVDVVIAIFI